MKFVLQYQDQFGSWKRWGEVRREEDLHRAPGGGGAEEEIRGRGLRDYRQVSGNVPLDGPANCCESGVTKKYLHGAVG